MPTKQSRTVFIAGQRLTILTDKDEHYLKRLVDHVEEVILTLRQGQRNATTIQASLLAAMNLADELFQERDRAAAQGAEVQRRTQQMITLLEKSTAARRG